MKWSWMFVAALPLVAACATVGDAGSETGDDEVVVGLPNLSNQVAVHPDRLEFDADVLAKLERRGVLAKIEKYASAADKAAVEPVYFVGERQADALDADGAIKPDARNPAGYLRRAVSWEKKPDGVVVVKTEPATLAEAIEEIKKNGFLDLNPDSVSALDNNNGENTDRGFGNADRRWRTTLGPETGFKPIDLSGRELWNKSLLSGGNAKVVLKTGRITIKPTLDVHLAVKRFIPKNAEATITTDVDAELEFEAMADGAFDLSHGDTLLKRSVGTQFKKLPLTVALEVKYDCGVAATGRAVASAGATAKGTLRAGAAVEGLRVRGILDNASYEISPLGPRLDSKVHVAGACHLMAEVTMQVFDAVGPKVTTDLYTILDADGTNAQASAKGNATLKAGVEASVGGALRPFGFKLADINAAPFKFEKVFSGAFDVGQ